LLCSLAFGKRRKKLGSKNISLFLLRVCFCSGGFATTNRQMLGRKVQFGLRPPFDLIPKYKEKCERSPTPAGRSEHTIASKFSESLEWSGRQDLNLRHPAPKAKRCRFQGFSKHFFYFHE